MAGKDENRVERVSTEDILKNYDAFYADHHFTPWPEDYIDKADIILPRGGWVKEYVSEHPGGHLLDLGGLDGFILFTALANGAKEGTLVDLSKDGIQIAIDHAERLEVSERFNWYAGNIEEFLEGLRLALPDRKYDYVTLFEVLEHVPDPKGLLEKINEVLAPGGQVFISTPDWDGHFGKDDFDHNHAHLRIYTYKDEAQDENAPSLPALVESVGGKVQENKVWGDLIHLRYSV
jgi:2-polyprenyl-3-methyl-5-hydroxy-6-metoxy-1,4-benzoquinol methylase